MSLISLLLQAAFLLVGWWLVKVISILHSTRGQPGFVAVIRPYSEFGQVVFPLHWRFNLGIGKVWALHTDLYRKYNSNVLVVPSLFPPVVTVLVADAQAINQVNNDHQHFVKDSISNGSIAKLFGPSVLTLEGAEWKRHRKIVGSAFSERNTSALWDATVDLTEKWIEGLQARQGDTRSIVVKNTEEIWACLALLIVGRAGFGIDFGWPTVLSSPGSSDESNSSQASFYKAASSILNNWIPLAFLPKVCLRPYPLTASIKRAVESQEIFEKELRQIVAKRVQEVKIHGKDEGTDKCDILTLLCRANVLEDAKSKLSDEELFSDAFVFLIAGHETTAGTIAAIFAFLAIYPSYQDAIFAEVSAHLEQGSPFTYSSSYRSLPMTLAVVQETLRLAGPAQATLRKSTAPTVLLSKTVAQDGTLAEGSFIAVPAHAHVREHMQGVHYTNVWADPTAFQPERFLVDKEKLADQMKAFLPFNSGSRGCPGRQFALVESVALVASVVSKFRIEVPAHEKEEWSLKNNDSENDRRDRVLKPLNFFALAPHAIDLEFVPRE